MAEEVKDVIKTAKENVVVVEAAILLTAGWQKFCHEVMSAIFYCLSKRLQTIAIFCE